MDGGWMDGWMTCHTDAGTVSDMGRLPNSRLLSNRMKDLPTSDEQIPNS
jgi:hypothetical protein